MTNMKVVREYFVGDRLEPEPGEETAPPRYYCGCCDVFFPAEHVVFAHGVEANYTRYLRDRRRWGRGKRIYRTGGRRWKYYRPADAENLFERPAQGVRQEQGVLP